MVSLPLLLEPGYSARNGADHAALIGDLLALPRVQIDDQVEDRALDAQAQLARMGHHRVPPMDLLIAALADSNRLGVLHYNRDYDLGFTLAARRRSRLTACEMRVPRATQVPE